MYALSIVVGEVSGPKKEIGELEWLWPQNYG
jgi:hypothetical protein